MAWAHRLVGEVAAAQVPPLAEEAEKAYRQAFGMGQEMRMRPLEARCRVSLAEALARLGKNAEARGLLNSALATFQELGLNREASRTERLARDLKVV